MVAKQRSLTLDVLRAVAVLLVFGNHMPPLGPSYPAVLRAVSEALIRGGWVGVDLFFVLSGFLVSGLLFREYQKHREIHVGRFLVRRGLKIYPGFYVFLAIIVIVLLGTHQHIWKKALLCETLFVQNYGPHMCNHTWSLAVEEHFYIGISLVMAALAVRGRGLADPFRALPGVFIAVAAVALGLRYYTAATSAYGFESHLARTHLRVDSLFFGVLIAYVFHFRRRALEQLIRGRELILRTLGVSLLVPAFLLERQSSPFTYTLGPTCFFIGSGFILLSLVFRELPVNLITRAFAFMGAHSYSIYLWHVPVLSWLVQGVFVRKFGLDSYSMMAVGLFAILSIVVGIAMAKLVEIPVLRLRDRFYPSRTDGLATAAESTPVVPAVTNMTPVSP